MAGEIDPVSQALGKLLADAETRQRQSADQYAQIGEIKEMVADVGKAVAVVVEKLSAHMTADERRFADNEHDIKNNKLGMTSLKAKVEGMEMTAARKVGTIGLIGALSAFVSAAVAAMARLGS